MDTLEALRGRAHAAGMLVRAEVQSSRVDRFLDGVCRDWLGVKADAEPTGHDRMAWFASLPA